jgi:hypothetical protein
MGLAAFNVWGVFKNFAVPPVSTAMDGGGGPHHLPSSAAFKSSTFRGVILAPHRAFKVSLTNDRIFMCVGR